MTETMKPRTCTRCGQAGVVIVETRPDEGAVVLTCGCKLSRTNLTLEGLRLSADGGSLEPLKTAPRETVLADKPGGSVITRPRNVQPDAG